MSTPRIRRTAIISRLDEKIYKWALEGALKTNRAPNRNHFHTFLSTKIGWTESEDAAARYTVSKWQANSTSSFSGIRDVSQGMRKGISKIVYWHRLLLHQFSTLSIVCCQNFFSFPEENVPSSALCPSKRILYNNVLRCNLRCWRSDVSSHTGVQDWLDQRFLKYTGRSTKIGDHTDLEPTSCDYRCKFVTSISKRRLLPILL